MVAVHKAAVSVAGRALRISAKDLVAVMASRPAIRDHLLRFVRSLMVQQAQTALCNAKHDTEQKIARWLLLAHGYTGEDTIAVTNDMLAIMLSVRRQGVSQALAKLEGDNIVVRTRGQLRIRNGDLLRSRSCACFATISEQFARPPEVETDGNRFRCA
jgi:CRP-like cAMP-binding protein